MPRLVAIADLAALATRVGQDEAEGPGVLHHPGTRPAGCPVVAPGRPRCAPTRCLEIERHAKLVLGMTGPGTAPDRLVVAQRLHPAVEDGDLGRVAPIGTLDS